MRVEMHLYCKWGVGGWDGNDTFLIPRDAVFTFSIVLCRRESSAAERGKVFCIFSTDCYFFLLNLSGKNGEDSWVQVTATQLGSSY